MIYADGCKYEGSWKYGKRHGAPSRRHLRAISARSPRDLGAISANIPYRAGCGTYTYANGDTYTGEWSAGAKEGSGRYRQHATGVTYQVQSPSLLLPFFSLRFGASRPTLIPLARVAFSTWHR